MISSISLSLGSLLLYDFSSYLIKTNSIIVLFVTPVTVLIHRGPTFLVFETLTRHFRVCGVGLTEKKRKLYIAMAMTRYSRFQRLLQPKFLFTQPRLLRKPLIRTRTVVRSTMGSSSSFSSKLLFRQLFEKESSTYTYLLADVSHPDKPALVSFAYRRLNFSIWVLRISCLILVLFSGIVECDRIVL